MDEKPTCDSPNCKEESVFTDPACEDEDGTLIDEVELCIDHCPEYHREALLKRQKQLKNSPEGES